MGLFIFGYYCVVVGFFGRLGFYKLGYSCGFGFLRVCRWACFGEGGGLLNFWVCF